MHSLHSFEVTVLQIHYFDNLYCSQGGDRSGAGGSQGSGSGGESWARYYRHQAKGSAHFIFNRTTEIHETQSK